MGHSCNVLNLKKKQATQANIDGWVSKHPIMYPKNWTTE
jgi:hypothetical protein